MREAGMDVELQNWRGVVAPRGISKEQETVLETMLVRHDQNRALARHVKRRGWGEATLAGEEFQKFVQAEQTRVNQVLDEIGLG